MSQRSVKTSFPQTRLSVLAARPGGVLRSDAIEGALKSIELMRGDGDTAIAKSIAAIEGIVFGARGKDLSEIEMHKVLRHADQIVTIAGTFCYAALDRVARSLCDLTGGLIRTKQYHPAPIAVHVQSLHLLAPAGTTLSKAHVAKIEEELAKVLAHYQFASLAKPDLAEDGEVSLGPAA